jgi:hypothetical protein
VSRLASRRPTARTTNVQDTWTIRNISYDFRVAPLGEGSEMLMIRPENEDFVLPAGRYGVVIKGQALISPLLDPSRKPLNALRELRRKTAHFIPNVVVPSKGSYIVQQLLPDR